VTRGSMLLQSALAGLVMGLIAGVSVLALLAIAVNLVPGIPERLVERLRLPVLVLLLGAVPLAAGVLGYLEGRAKIP
jgi:hypothetical protein